MGAVLDDILTLARSSTALSEEQLSQILALAPLMSEADLERLRVQLTEVQAAELKATKKNIAVLKAARAAETGWEAAEAHTVLQKKAESQATSDVVQAESLLHNI